MTITSQQLRELAGKATQEDMRVIRVKGHTHSQAWNKGICAEGEDVDCDLIAALWNNREALLTALELQERLDKPETVSLGADIIADNVSGPTLREVDWKALHRADQENAVRKFINALKGGAQ